MLTQQLLLLELNEVNFDDVDYYCNKGLLPNLARLIRRHGVAKTTSEKSHQELEPWIQWVTAHTGKSFSEHGVFRLGDIVKYDIPQIWEQLESKGLRVGAISPMNAKNRLQSPAFFVPDPWTPTSIVAPGLLRKMSEAVSQVVNDNAQTRVTMESLLWLLLGIMSQARLPNYAVYWRWALSAWSRPWRRAMFLDLLLADVFVRSIKRTSPHFATLFLNAAAHIQHHYLFNAESYSGKHRNPDWYAKKGVDPVLDVYESYDRIVGQVSTEFPKARLMIATGLHQDPHGEVTYYWRLRDHASFLAKMRVPFEQVQPLMSRDFTVKCASEAAAAVAATRLRSFTSGGCPLFEVDNRGPDLFVMLTYPHEITRGFVFEVDGKPYRDFLDDVAFVALKNGQHNGVGYFLDTGRTREDAEDEFQLRDLPQRIMACFSAGLEE